MHRLLPAVLIVALVTSGCASLTYAIKATPERAREAFSDPIRLVHLLTKASLEMSTVGVGITCAFLMPIPLVGLLACPAVALLYNFAVYEYVLDPISQDRLDQGKSSLQGPYWETGPFSDEGEFFTCGEMPSHTCIPAKPKPKVGP